VPLVVTVWGSDVLVFGEMPAARRLLKSTFTRAQAVIAVSDELSQRAAELGADPRRLFTVPGGVPYRLPLPRQAERERHGLADGEICVLWVGGLVPVKQPLEAVRAFEAFVSESRATDVRLVMVGDGPLRSVVSDLVRERNLDRTVQMLGHLDRDAVWRWQSAADVLINCSRSEGTPLAVLESLGAGTPVAAYPLPGIRAAVEAVDGGTLAENRSPADLAAAIGSELSTRRDRDALARDARARFDIAGVGRAIEAVYDSVLGPA
jgi:glycosyltransferase involved in cell wall biosynthesis